MKRTERFVAVPGGQCLVTVDLPDQAPAALLACAHGLTGDRCGPGEILSRLGEQVAGHGVAMVRFDFRGSGDSSGHWGETTFAGMVSDYLAVLDWAITQVGEPPALVLAGLSTGGVIAALAASRRRDARGLLLLSTDFWEEPDPAPFVEPVRDGEFHEPLGMPLERAELRAHDVLSSLTCQKTLIYGEQDDLLAGELPRLSACGVESIAIAGTGHLFEGVAARRQLAELTLRYVKEVLAR